MNFNFFQSRKFLIPFNACSFYFLWLLIITEVAKAKVALSPLALGFFLILHLVVSRETLLEITFISIFTLLGLLGESLLLQFGLHSYKAILNLPSFLPPLWLLGIYLITSSTFSTSLSWLKNQHIAIKCILGFAGGVSSYWFGYQTGVLKTLENVYFVLPILGSFWAIFFPFGFYLRKLLSPFFSTPNPD
ncbi:MAG: DUF2878 domain-containing protein [Chlamydiales bacterium]|nr:DUF2878 domain-containing protein [Chlamydiales bacterium]